MNLPLAVILVVTVLAASSEAVPYKSSINDEFPPVVQPTYGSCPRDCKCELNAATCRLIDADIQNFNNRIQILNIEALNNKYPIKLDKYIFKNAGLRYVTVIKIINSTIDEIQVSAFGNLPYLSSVEMRSTNLKSIYPDLFVTNPKLKTINLCDNPIEHVYENLLTAPSLEEIVICNAKITHLNETSFSGLPNAVYINLANNQIRNIHPDTFNKLLNLEELDLSNNYISSIANTMFAKNLELSVLKLNNNLLRTAETINSESLETLELSNCQIEHITNTMLSDVPNLIDLKLNSNGLKTIHPDAFKHLTELFDIDLSNNNLQFIPDELFHNNGELTSINLSNNPKLKYLPESGFTSRTESIPISLFDISNCGLVELTNNTFLRMESISVLNLSNNRIKYLPELVFYSLQNLKDIDLSKNLIEKIDLKVFRGNHYNSINLSKNPLKVLFTNDSSMFENLATLDLSYCQLSDIDWGKMTDKTLDAMKSLNISNNNFTKIDGKLLKIMPNLIQLDLSNNPLECNKEFATLIQWLIAHNVQIAHSEPTHLPNSEHSLYDNSDSTSASANDLKLRWNQLTRSVCKDKPIEEQITTTEYDSSSDDYDGDDDDYDYLQYDQTTLTAGFNVELDEAVEVKATLLKYANYTNIIMFLIGAITSSTIVFLFAYCIRMYRMRRPANRFISTLAAARTRTDCGLVYKPLSEEKITSPRTSMLSRLYEPYLYPNQENQTKAYQEMKSTDNS